MRALGPKSLASVMKRVFDVMFYLTIFGGVLVMVITIALPLVESDTLTRNPEVYFELDPSAYDISSEALGIASAEITEARGRIKVVGVSREHMLVVLGFGLALVGMVALGLAYLREIFQTLKEANPFIAANAARIRVIAFLVIIGELLRAGVVAGESVQLARRLTTVGLRIRPEFDVNGWMILLGLVLLVIAEVFRLGAKMKEEQQLTV